MVPIKRNDRAEVVGGVVGASGSDHRVMAAWLVGAVLAISGSVGGGDPRDGSA